MDGALTHGIIVLEMETLGRSPTLAPAGRGRAAEHGARRRLSGDRDRGCRHTQGEAHHGARQDGQEANHVLCSGAKAWLAGSGSVGPEAAGAGPLPPGLSCRWRSEKRSQQRKHFERKRPVLVSEPTGRRRRGDGGRVGGPPLPATAPPAAAPPATRSALKGPREALASGWSQTVSPWPVQEERPGGRATSRAGSGAGSYGTTSWDPATARPVRGPRGRVLLHGSGEQTCQAQEAPSQRQILNLLGRCSRGARWGRLAGRRGRGGRGGPHMPCLGSLSKISVDNTLQSRTLLSAEKQDCSI